MAKQSALDRYRQSLRQSDTSSGFQERYTNARVQAKSFAKEIEEAEGIQLSEEEIRNLTNQILETGSFNYQAPARQQTEPEPAEQETPAPVVPEKKGYLEQRLTEFADEAGEIGTAVNTLGAGIQRAVAGQLEQGARGLEGFFGDETIEKAKQSMGLIGTQLPSDTLRDFAKKYRQAAEATRPATQAQREAFAEQGGLEGQFGQGLLDALESPTAALSLVGGPVGAVAVADVYAQSYAAGYEEGLRGPELEAWAWSQAAPEGLAMIPAGKVIERIPVLGPLMKKRASQAMEGLTARMTNPAIATAMTTAKTAVGESIEEIATGTAQDLAAAAFAGQEKAKELAEFAKTQAPLTESGEIDWEKFAESRVAEARAAVVTAGLGGLAQAPRIQQEFTQAKAAEVEDTLEAALTGDASQREARTAPLDRALETAARDAGRRRTIEETQRAFDQAESEQAAQRELEEEAGFRTIERDRALGTRTERLPEGDIETPYSPAAPITPDEVAVERELAAAEEATRQRNLEEGDALAKLRQQAEVRAEKAKKSEAAKKGAETQRRNRLAAKLLEENPDKTPEELAPILAEQLRQSVSQPDLDAQKVQAIRNQLEGIKKAKLTRAERAKLRGLVRANPDLSNEEIAQLYRGEEAAPARPTTRAVAEEGVDDTPSTDDLRAQLEAKRGTLKMAGRPTLTLDRGKESELPTGIPADRTEEQQKTYEDKARKAVSALSRANTNQTADVQNLIRQGKVVLTSNQADMGFDDTGAAGEYDVDEGKMYVYLDNVTPDEVPSVVAAALHESTHAGQFNDRQGRPDIYRQMMGERGVAEANQKIRRAAQSGNAVAQRALAAAREAAGEDVGTENLELVPYFVSEAVAARGSTLGRLGGVVRDITSSAKNFARDKLGREIPFSISDIDSAAQRVGQEIVQTTVEGQAGGGRVEMIAGRQAPGFAQAQEEGRTYRGRVDQLERFEIPDNRSTVTTDSAPLDDLLEDRTVPLGEILGHEALYEQYPELAAISVSAKKDLKGAKGQWDASNATIHVAPFIVNRALAGNATGSTDTLHSILLHEVQHAIQTIEGFVPGTAQYAFVDPQLKKDLDLSNQRWDDFIKNFEIKPAVESLSPRAAADWRATLLRAGSPTDPTTIKTTFLNGGFAAESTKAGIRQQGEKFKEIKANQNRDAKAFNDANDQAFLTYLRDYGETEARNTQIRAFMEDKFLAENPPESTMGLSTEGARQQVNVEDTVDTRPLINPQAVSSNRLAMAGPASQPAQVPDAQFTQRERIRRVLAHGQRNRLADIKAAEDLDTQFQEALIKDTGSSRLTDEVNTEILKALKEGNEKSLRAKFPATAKIVEAAREQIRRDTVDILDSLLNSGRPLSVEERRAAQAMLANMDTYLSRAYAAYQQGIGKGWAKRRWKNYESNLGNAVDSITNPKVRQDVKYVRDAIAFLRKDLEIPANDVLIDMPMDKLVDMYERWGDKVDRLDYDRAAGNAAELKREALINSLARTREALTPAMLDKAADDAAKALLGVDKSGSRYVRQLSALAKDPGTLKKKQRVPLEIRKLLGEIESAPGVILSTLSNQAALKARIKVHAELLSDHMGTLVATPEMYRAMGSPTEKMGPKLDNTEWVLAEGPSWGQLEGMYINPKLHKRMEETLSTFVEWQEAFSNLEQETSSLVRKIWDTGLPKTLGTANRWVKGNTVILNPFNWIGNALGSPVTMLGSGNFSPSAAYKGMMTAGDYVAGTFLNTTTVPLEDAIRYLNMEAADIGELQNVLGNKMKKYLDGTLDPKDANGAIRNSIKKATEGTGRSWRTVVAAYAVADNWAKVSNFYHRMGILRDFYDAAGVEKSDAEIAQEAGDDTSYTNLSPERVPAWITGLERRGFSQYAPYFAEVIRTRYTGFAMAATDMARANQMAKAGNQAAANVLYKAATTRLVGHTLASAAIPAIGAIRMAPALALLGLGAEYLPALMGDDDEMELKRRLLSDMGKDQDVMLVGYHEDGRPMYLAVSQRFDPNGPFTDIIRAMVYNDTWEDKAKAMAEYVATDLFIEPLWLKKLYDAATDATPSESGISRLFPELKQALDDGGIDATTADRALGVIDQFMPGIIKAQATQYTPEGMMVKTGDPEVDKKLEQNAVAMMAQNLTDLTGREVTKVDVAKFLNATGARFETLDPARRLTAYAAESSDRKSENRGKLNRRMFNVPEVTRESVLDNAMKFRMDEIKRQQEDYKNVRALREWGIEDPDKIAGLLKEGGYGEKEIPALVAGEGQATLSLQSFGTYVENTGGWQDFRDKERSMEKGRKIIKMLIDMEDDLAEIGVVLDKKSIPKELKP